MCNWTCLQNVVDSNGDTSDNSALAYIARNEDPQYIEKKYIDNYIG